MDTLRRRGDGIGLEWAAEGVAALVGECAVLVVVDVLSFSTKVDVMLHEGQRVRPLRWDDVPLGTAADGVVPWPSPNGATLCVEAAGQGARVLAGCLRNARAVARAALSLSGDAPIGVIPAGERWGVNVGAAPGTSGPLRPCVEDHLGAGAIVAALLDEQPARSPSAEAMSAALTFRAAAAQVGALVAGSVSGRDLHDHGRFEDVDQAAAVDVSAVVPLLTDGTFGDAARHARVTT